MTYHKDKIMSSVIYFESEISNDSDMNVKFFSGIVPALATMVKRDEVG